MRSSTSNSDASRLNLRKSWLLALALVVVATGAWEFMLRDAGLDPAYADNRALWLSARHRLSQLDESAIALVGASRMQRAIDVDTLSHELDRAVVQLAVEGTSAIPMLENLAADPRFRGTVIYSVAPAFASIPHQTVEFSQGLSMALVEDCFLVGEIVIERGLSQAQVFGDVVQGGGVIPLLPKRAESCMQYLRAPTLSLFANVRRHGCLGTSIGHNLTPLREFERLFKI